VFIPKSFLLANLDASHVFGQHLLSKSTLLPRQ
jgi:hypothetical protein